MSAVARRWWIGAGVFLLLAWLVGYPLVITTFAAFVPEASAAGAAASAAASAPFSEFMHRPDEWTALFRSLWISLASVGLAGLVGVPLGFLFARAEFPGRRVLGELLALPVALPPLVGVIAFLYLYGESGMATRLVGDLLRIEGAPWRLTGPGAILLVHTYSMYVYFYLFTRAALARFDGAQLEAAASLGADALRRFRHHARSRDDRCRLDGVRRRCGWHRPARRPGAARRRRAHPDPRRTARARRW